MVSLVSSAFACVMRVYPTLKTIAAFHFNPLADLSLLKEGLSPCINPIDSEYHEAVVNRILVSYRKAKSEQEKVSLAYRPGGEWDADIKTRRANYLKALSENDISSLSNLLQNFFRNSGAAGLLSYSAYQDITGASRLTRKWFINCILQDLATWKDLVDKTDVSSLSAPPHR